MAEPVEPDFDFDAHIAKLIAARFVLFDSPSSYLVIHYSIWIYVSVCDVCVDIVNVIWTMSHRDLGIP